MNDPGAKILVVDDEAAIRRFLSLTLVAQSYKVIEAANGQEAVDLAMECKPDAAVIDLGLPDMDGVDVIRLLREWTQVPVIVLSVRGAEADKIGALDAGADDYLVKPFSSGELLARLRAALRRARQPSNEPVLVVGELSVDLPDRHVTLSGSSVQLTPTEYELLRLLVSNAGRVLTQHYILDQVWGLGYERAYHTLHVNISNLRRKIELDPTRPQYIITEPGVGYRLRVT
jgi:two-component system, OmpR family, KDP operon response regulator KdpE